MSKVFHILLEYFTVQTSMKNNRNILIAAIVATAVIFAGVYYFQKPEASILTSNNSKEEKQTQTEESASKPTSTEIKLLASPITNAPSRITKKPFGIKIDPRTSPVQPEKFIGYHTGTDFETTTEEAKQDVKVFALCAGKLLQKRTASGYGGIIVQACSINDKAITVVYGHIDLSSVTDSVGQELNTGDPIAILGDIGPETDGERKHLHLGIHKGSTINIKGYVQSNSELAEWIDYKSLGI